MALNLKYTAASEARSCDVGDDDDDNNERGEGRNNFGLVAEEMSVPRELGSDGGNPREEEVPSETKKKGRELMKPFSLPSFGDQMGKLINAPFQIQMVDR